MLFGLMFIDIIFTLNVVENRVYHHHHYPRIL